MKRLHSYILSAAAITMTVITVSSCNKDQTSIAVPQQCADTISFSGIVEPMIQANCATSGCHGAASSAAGYNLEGHLNISANANAILNVIRHESGVVAMPYFQPKMNDSIIEQFNCWVFQGKMNN
jgi:hypothetical protein